MKNQERFDEYAREMEGTSSNLMCAWIPTLREKDTGKNPAENL